VLLAECKARSEDGDRVISIDEKLTNVDEQRNFAFQTQILMRLSTLPLAFSFALGVQAQVAIDQNDMPHSGDELVRTRAVSNPFLNYGATGAAHVWDFDNLVAQEQDVKAYQTTWSTNFIYGLTYADIFFNPNRANHATAGVDIAFNEVLPIENPYTFFYRSNSVYKKVGYGAEVSGFPLPIPLEEHDVIYQLPLNYGDSDTSNSAYQIAVPSVAYYGHAQTRTNHVDGWGVIATPAGSFDVLRVKTTLSGRDSIALENSPGFAFDRPLVTEYKWLAHGMRVPILQINTTRIFGFELVTEVFFYDVPRSLAVDQSLALELCPGVALDVPYSATGAFNAGGFLVQANTFRAQLSDANGDFSNPVQIGTVTSTTSGTITATIPANTPLGTGYRIRVIATNPALVGPDNGVDITIGGPPTATALANGPTAICGGGSVTLEAAVAPGYNFQWHMDGAPIIGANSAVLETDLSGAYTVEVTSACGTSLSAAVVVEVHDLPAHTLYQSAFSACEGGSITITAADLSGQTDLSYQWLLNDEPIAGEQGTEIIANVAGGFSVLVNNTVTGCSFTTDATVISFEPLPVATIVAQGATTFCAGGSVTLTAMDTPGMNYQWFQDGTLIAGASGSTLIATQSGEFTVVLTSAAACTSLPAAGVSVYVAPLPAAPMITASGEVSVCAGGSVQLAVDVPVDGTVQWLNDGVAIADAIDPVLDVTATGTYTAVLTSGEGCTVASANDMTVTVFDTPEVPEIAQDGGLLSTSGTGTFQWFLDGVLIDGATDATLPTIGNGSYTVVITNIDGCSSTSEPYVYLSTGIDQHTTNTFTLFPNPASAQVTLIAAEALGDIQLLDNTGRLVRTERTALARYTLSVQDLAPGAYLVRTMNTTLRLVVE